MGKLLAGAGKACISPSKAIIDELYSLEPNSYTGIYKDVYVRCVALSDGTEKFLIFSIEMNFFPAQRRFRDLLQKELGVHPDAVMLGNTHNHQMARATDPAEQPPGGPPFESKPQRLREINEELIQFFHSRALQAAREAVANLVPAKMGYASGTSYINASRDWPTPVGGLQNSDYGGYSDRELVVMKVESLDGNPIATLVNFGVHSNMLYGFRFNGQFTEICGDIAGEIMEFVENASAGKDICLWVEAAAGDQNPLVTGFVMGVKAEKDGTFSQTRSDLDAKSTILIMEHLAQVQGLEILKTSKSICNMGSDFELKYGRSEYAIPGVVNARVRFNLAFKGGDDDGGKKRNTVMPEELRAAEPIDSDPVVFKFHLAVLNGLAFCGINTEPYSYLGRIIKDVLPYPKAMIFAIDAGHLGYLPDVRKAEYAGFGTLDSHAKSPWDIERAVYEGFRDLSAEIEKEKEK